MTHHQVWQAVLAELELSLSRANFVTWFKNTFIGRFENGEAEICVPSAFTKTWLEKKFHPVLTKLIEKTTNEPLRSLTYRVEIVRPAADASALPPSAGAEKESFFGIASPPADETINAFGLSPRYTFEGFIVGKGNELAHAAAQAIVARPGKAYNPLFIYGGAGLGKTHLLQAVGNEIACREKKKKIVYATCEKFTNEFIRAIGSKNIKDFYNAYRHADVLLIDDIQFLSNKTETQEAFFNTFNDLHQQDKQIMLTSDRPPKAITSLENRLRTRFEMGMIADVIPPDLETRMAILMAKTQEKNISLDDESLQFIASAIQNNVRELEGALNKLHAYCQLKKTAPDIDTIKNLIASLENSASQRNLTPKYIIQIVTEYFDIKTEEVLGKSREKRLAYPRQIIMFLLRQEIKSSFPAIGQELGGRDHSTAMHACQKIETEMNHSQSLRQDLAQIRQRLFSV